MLYKYLFQDNWNCGIIPQERVENLNAAFPLSKQDLSVIMTHFFSDCMMLQVSKEPEKREHDFDFVIHCRLAKLGDSNREFYSLLSSLLKYYIMKMICK